MHLLSLVMSFGVLNIVQCVIRAYKMDGSQVDLLIFEGRHIHMPEFHILAARNRQNQMRLAHTMVLIIGLKRLITCSTVVDDGVTHYEKYQALKYQLKKDKDK